MKTGSSKGQVVSIQTIIGIVAVSVMFVAGVFFFKELQTLLALLLNNLIYTSAIAVALLTAVAGYQWSINQDDLNPWTFPVGGLLIIGLVIAAPFATGQLSEALSSYTVTVEADVDGGQISKTEYNGLKVTNIESGQPVILSPQQGSIISTDYRIEVEVTCEGESVGRTTIKGEAPSDSTSKITGIPGNSQCVATGTIKEPLDAIGANTYSARFTTP